MHAQRAGRDNYGSRVRRGDKNKRARLGELIWPRETPLGILLF